MAQAYITEKLWHMAMILNQVPGCLWINITTLFELVHNTKTDPNTWFKLFYIVYFNQSIYNTEIQSKIQAHTLSVIAVGWDEK